MGKLLDDGADVLAAPDGGRLAGSARMGTPGSPSLKGEHDRVVDRLARYNAVDKSPVYQQVSGSTYDKLGRPLTATNALNRTVKTSYVPDDTGYGPLTSKTTTSSAPQLFTTTAEVDPAWGSATKSTDANGNLTEWAFDALGRLRSVWKPDRSHALGDAASIGYAEAPRPPSHVSSLEGTPRSLGVTWLPRVFRPEQCGLPAVTLV
ncbi:hypothetical protein ABZV65_06775 [Streptomyces bauhiniae]|uniref:hypothetical protein n=1 Tax=Streptomyces bauhiniae TaxID=2340725 RepID=UPI00339FF809